ncbi:MAG: efflux RND transporter periplasmic adaptor subunit [Alphaproteobacteria bacterium]|nr:efflux RND transporter periplasmic adaptor subunit [Alphaproteobacteria bacterium]
MFNTSFAGKLFLCTALASISIALCSCKDKTNQASSQQFPKVEVVEAVQKNIPLRFEFTARAQGSKETEVRARVDGILQKRNYTEGADVQEGDVLFEIDPEQYKIALQQAEAELAQANAQLEEAQNNWERISKLFKERIVSEKSKDEAKSTLGTKQAAQKLAEAKVAAAKLNYDYTKVTAPISGATGQEAYSEGSLITKNGLLTHITQLDPIYVMFSISENEMISMRKMVEKGRLAKSQDETPVVARLYLSDDSLYSETGKIDFVTPNIDTTTGTIKVRAIFPNADKIIRPGQFLRLVIEGLNSPNAFNIPQSAVMQGANGSYVYRVNAQNKVETVNVKTGLMTQDNNWIIEEGLNVGDKVITKGLVKVRPDMEVIISDNAE